MFIFKAAFVFLLSKCFLSQSQWVGTFCKRKLNNLLPSSIYPIAKKIRAYIQSFIELFQHRISAKIVSESLFFFFFSFFVDHVLTITQTLFVQKIINSFARFWPTSFNFLHTQKEAKDILVPIFNKVSFLFHFAQFSLISI